MAGPKGVARGPGSLVAPAGRVGTVGGRSRRGVVCHGSIRWDDRGVHAVGPGTVAAAVRALRSDFSPDGDLPGTCEGTGSPRSAGSPLLDPPGVKPLVQTSCRPSAVGCRPHQYVLLRGLSPTFRRHPLTTNHPSHDAGTAPSCTELSASVL